MTKIEIKINGVSYPCRETMGAMLRFRNETGRDVTKMNASEVSDLCTYLWCCVASACKADGIAFDIPLMDFADSITPDVLTAWSEARAQESPAADGDSEKKSPRQ